MKDLMDLCNINAPYNLVGLIYENKPFTDSAR